MITTQSIFAPHVWSLPQLARMFENISNASLASSLEEINKQVLEAFDESLAWTRLHHPSADRFVTCPEGNRNLKILNKDIFISGTVKEFFFFGENGALEVRKQGPVYHREVRELLAMNYNFQQLYVCYAKLGADGCTVWGDDILDKNKNYSCE